MPATKKTMQRLVAHRFGRRVLVRVDRAGGRRADQCAREILLARLGRAANLVQLLLVLDLDPGDRQGVAPVLGLARGVERALLAAPAQHQGHGEAEAGQQQDQDGALHAIPHTALAIATTFGS